MPEVATAEPATGLSVVSAPLPVVHVTLFEDRAHVVRRGTVSLPAGAVVMHVSDVSPVVADRTLRCRLVSGGATVVEARMRRLMVILSSEKPEETRALHEQLRVLETEIAASDARIDGLRHSLTSFKEARGHTLAELAVDASWGRGNAAEWRGHLDRVGEREREARVRLADEQLARDVLAARHGDLNKLIAIRQRPTEVLRTTLEIQLDAPQAGDVELECAYTVPGACWRPAHTARMVGAKVELKSEGCVWQNTGEDWKDVRLSFSTQRLSRGVEPPPLTADIVAVQKKPQQLVVETREQEVATTGLGTGTVTVQQVPGIDDGGETRHLEAAAKATVPSDGRPHRVPLFSFETSAAQTRVVIAEASMAVHLKTEQVNEARQPLLAGPVDLVRESGFVGRTTLLFVAPGERFALGWGPDSALRVRRQHEEVEEQTTLMNALSAWTTVDHRVTVRLSNIGDEPRTIEVTERVPVSEVEKVQVAAEAKDTTHGLLPDRDGFVRWTLTVPPNENGLVKLRYKMRRHRDVVEG